MKCSLVTKVKFGGWILFVLSLVVPAVSPLRAQTALSAEDVIQRAVARAQQAQARAGVPIYHCTRVTVTEELDTSGNVKERKERLYDVCFRDGAAFAKLVKVNGRPAGAAEAKSQAENEMNLRQFVGGPKSPKGGQRENVLTPELVARYDFTMLDQTMVNGRPSYRLAFRPKVPAVCSGHIADRLLNRISGTVWIDAQEFEIARAEVRLGSEVDLLGGVVGCLKRLAFTLTRTRVADGLWFNTYSNGDFEGRKLLDAMHVRTKSQSTNFRPDGFAY